MKKRNILSGLLALVMATSLTLSVCATEINGEGNSDINVNYLSEDTFIINIPAEININPGSGEGSLYVSISDAIIDYDKIVAIEVSSNDYVDKWELTNSKDENVKIPYSITSIKFGEISNGDVVARHHWTNYEGKTSGWGMKVEVLGTAENSGSYSDILTFTASVQDEKYKLMEFETDEDFINFLNTSLEFEDSIFHPVYSQYDNSYPIPGIFYGNVSSAFVTVGNPNYEDKIYYGSPYALVNGECYYRFDLYWPWDTPDGMRIDNSYDGNKWIASSTF